ncbi:MAG TPA: polysaccharide deacetylase family protein [Methylocella sp.]|nr:polysaccharide deacetylase family protein [Methylocella sp.]
MTSFLLSSATSIGNPCVSDALGVARTIDVGTGGGLQVGLKTYPQTLALDDHEVAITFDDGPSAQTTPKILDALAKECVKATFFVIGRNVEALPSLVRREVAEGHTVGHHSFSHPAATLRHIGQRAAEADILKGIEVDDKAAYGSSNGAPRVPFFRFPGFADTPELIAFLSARNIAVFGADVWASDWQAMAPEEELALILARLEHDKRGILLLHDTKPQTAAMLPSLLRRLKERGFRIVALAPGERPPPLRASPPGWTSETEKIIAQLFDRSGHPKQKTPVGPSVEGMPFKVQN